MPRADLSAPAATTAARAVVSAPATVRGWAGGEGVRAMLVRPRDIEDIRSAVTPPRGLGRSVDPGAGAIARGMGRSYGDAAQLAGGLVIEMTGLRTFSLDGDRGTVTAAAGTTIGELLEALVPRGWMLPVVPGTQHVTVGGAIASDIHGKNHGVAGTLGRHVQALGLLAASGDVLELAPASGAELFAATLGGMGLTGVILWARIALERINSPVLSVDTTRVGTLDDALAALAAPGGSYRVAWLDLLGRRPARGIVTRAEHLTGSEAAAGTGGAGGTGGAAGTGGVAGQSVARLRAGRRVGATVPARATVPERWPSGLMRPRAVRAFNELRFRRSRTETGRLTGFGAHMFPLDSLDAWPRLYGRAGFVQYQLAVPRGCERVLETAIERLRRSRVPCYLATLKDLGPANDAPLSFPISGWTLALDLPRAASGIDSTLSELDRIVASSGGRVYLTKDARLEPDALSAMYPRLDEWRAVRDEADPDRIWRSDLALRTGLIAAPE
jgi:decaprenylphospho-beta-D-ribofuranose 2-oxidase